MKKYNVTNALFSKSKEAETLTGLFKDVCRDNYIGQPIEAKSEEEAIEFAIDFIVDHADGDEIEKTEQGVNVKRRGDIIETYCFFEAEEI